jgi:hypothetical protein
MRVLIAWRSTAGLRLHGSYARLSEDRFGWTVTLRRQAAHAHAHSTVYVTIVGPLHFCYYSKQRGAWTLPCLLYDFQGCLFILGDKGKDLTAYARWRRNGACAQSM